MVNEFACMEQKDISKYCNCWNVQHRSSGYQSGVSKTFQWGKKLKPALSVVHILKKTVTNHEFYGPIKIWSKWCNSTNTCITKRSCHRKNWLRFFITWINFIIQRFDKKHEHKIGYCYMPSLLEHCLRSGSWQVLENAFAFPSCDVKSKKCIHSPGEKWDRWDPAEKQKFFLPDKKNFLRRS